MEINKPNDIFVTTIDSPTATTYDIMSAGITPDNTSLLQKDAYKTTKFIQDTFKTPDGKFDDLAFNSAYNLAANHFQQMSDDSFLKDLNTIQYSPFDITRPKNAQTFKVDVEFGKDINPFQTLYGRTGVNSVDESPLSRRELAQQSKIFDPETNTWSKESANDLGLLNKLFGDTNVYAIYDEDGTNIDPISGRTIKHQKGDWKVSPDGNLFLEKLGKREIYGRQVVNPLDILTTDGSLADKYNFLDSDGKNKSIAGIGFKVAAEIAPLLIPGVGIYYGGIKAAVTLASVLPTFYKSFEGLIMGDDKTPLTDAATAAEGYMSKFVTSSISEKGQTSAFSGEQMSSMVSSIFSQLYEQRAAASLAKLFTKSQDEALKVKEIALGQKIYTELQGEALKGKIDPGDVISLTQAAMEKVPELKAFQASQSQLSKALSLGYMAMSTTSNIYGDAIQGGYDKRTAGFATLLAAGGQYGIMMNNRMGDWFLDKTTGYSQESNKALIRQSVMPYLDEVKDGFSLFDKNAIEGKKALAGIVTRSKNALVNLLTTPSVIGESIFKNSLIEGVEEVTEQAVQDMSTGVVDMMSSLGMTKKKGSLNTWDNTFSEAGFEKYMSNLVGGIVGGAMFEYHRSKIEPWLDPSNSSVLTNETKKSIYQLVADGHTDEIVSIINRERKKLGNKYLSPTTVEGDVAVSSGDPLDITNVSQADLIADKTIQMVQTIDGIINSSGLGHSDDEIIKKAIVDNILIKGFEKSKEGGRMGIEGIILSDYKENMTKLVDINIKLGILSADAKEDPTKGKEEIKQYREEAKIYNDKINNILTGKNAESYFDQALFYLAKPISESWIAIDKNTYSKTKYGKEYLDLKENGIGITKERVDKEFKDYKEGKNVKADLEVSTLAYKELEKNLNPSIAKYTDNGYKEERKKTIENLVNFQNTIDLFGTDKEAIKQYIETVKNIESKTGKRIIPWDVIETSFADKMLNTNSLIDPSTNQPLTSAYLEEKIGDGEETRGEYLKNFLSKIVSYLPSDNIDYEIVSNTFNSKIGEFNSGVDTEINKITSTLNSTTSEEDRLNIEAQVKDLESKKLNVQLLPFEKSQSFKIQNAANIIKLKDKQNSLQIDDNNLVSLDKLNFNSISDKFVSYSDILSKHANELGKDVVDLTDEEKLDALSEITTIENEFNKTDEIKNLLTAKNGLPDWDNIEKIIDSFILKFNNLKDTYGKYKEYSNYLDSIIKKPEFFAIQDYGLEAIIKEIKKSKNLDQELLLKVQDMLSLRLNAIKNTYLKGMQLSNLETLDLINNSEDYYKILAGIQGDFSSQINDEDINPSDLKLNETLLPKYLNDSINSAENPEDGVNALLKNIYNLNLYKDNNKKYFDNITELKEIGDNKDSFISNSIYDFIKQNIVSLVDKSKLRKVSVFDILKAEETSLFSVSDVTNYLSEGIRDSDMQEAMNNIDLVKSVVYAMSTTEVDYGDPYGFIASRQNFLTRNKIKSDTLDLKTISSDVATMMINDLDRIKNKLSFLKELSKSNSGKIFNESEITREVTSKLFLTEWGNLSKLNMTYKNQPIIPNLLDIINSKDTDEKKLLNIETAFFTQAKAMNLSVEEQLELMKTIMEKGNYSFIDSTDSIYNKEGDNEIGRDIKQLSDNDFIWYLASNLSVNARDFNNKLLNILKSDFDKAPFYNQELAGRILYSSVVNPGLFAGLVDTTQHPKTINTNHITYVLGGAGTGKTTVIFKALILMLKENNTNLSVWFTAPHSDQANKLTKEVTDKIDTSKFNINTFNKFQLFEKLGITDIVKDINDKKFSSEYITNIPNEDRITLNTEKLTFQGDKTDLPNLIFIDEGTHLTAMELGIINELVKRSETEGKAIKLVVAGDIAQNGVTFNNTSYNIDRVSGIFTPFLNLTVRASNSQKRDNNDSLSALVRKSIKIFEDPGKDSPTIMNYIGKGVPLKYFLNKNTINGDVLTTSNEIPTNILNTLKNIITEDPTKIIGILSDNGELDPGIKTTLDKIGITENNIKVYSPNNIQGSESDYFIFKASQLKGAHILASLKNLYTYMSRSKFGTIIINDSPITNLDGTVLLIEPISNDYTEFVEPLKKEVIDQAKNERIKKLTDLLDPDFNITDDHFKFDNTSISVGEDEVLDTVARETIIEDESIQTIKNKELNLKLSQKADDNKFMSHTFYNDINVKFEHNGNKVIISQNSNQDINYGLNFLFKPGETSKELTEDQFKKYTNDLVDLKYNILRNGFKVPSGNDILGEIFNHNAYTVNQHPSEVVLVRTNYSTDHNEPFEKKVDDVSKHLNNNDKYLNLFLKISYGNDQFYYLHLASFGANETIKKTFGVNSESYKKYIELINSPNKEIILDPKQISSITSTRLVDSTKPFTLLELSKLPGIKFLKGGKTFTNEIAYNLFPTDEDSFIKLYKSFTFGEPISEDLLRKMFNGSEGKPGYKGKPYAAVTFYEDNSHVQLILLKSKTRTWGEIKNIVITNSLVDKLTHSDLNVRKEGELLRDSLFSGSQVLDLLISLGKEQPKLFSELFNEGFLEKSDKSEFFKTYFDSIQKTLKKDIIALTSFESEGEDSKLRLVIKKIGSAIKDAQKLGESLDENKLRKDVLPFIKSSNTQWFRRFWNILEVYRKTSSILGKTDVSPEIKTRYTELQKILSNIFKFWESKDIYYNTPIVTNKGTGPNEIKYRLANSNLDKEFLYTKKVPEGPRLLIDLSSTNLTAKPVTIPTTITIPTKVKKASAKDIKTLKTLTGGYSDEVVLTGEESEGEIKEAIQDAILLNTILDNPNNTDSIHTLTLSSTEELQLKLDKLKNKNNTTTLNIAIDSLSKLLTTLPGNTDQTQLQKLVTVFTQKLSFMDDPENVDKTDDDDSFRKELFQKWNSKSFGHFNNGTKVDIVEFLDSIKDESYESITQKLTNGDPMNLTFEGGFESGLSNYIYDNLGIDTYMKDLSVMASLFDC